MTVDGTYSVAGTTLVSGGEVDFTTAASTAALTETGGTIGGSATLTISGLTTWTNGTMSGTGVTNANGGLMLGGSVASAYTETLSGRTLNNAGAATVSYFAPQGGSSLTLSSGATFDNKAGATFAFITDGPITAGTGGGSFINEGALSKTTTTGTSTINVPLNDIGTATIAVQTGTISLRDMTTVSSTGVLSVAVNAVLAFDAGTATLSDGTTISGAGAVVVRGATVNIPTGTATDATPVTFSSGTIGGAGTLTVSGPLTWTGGTMSGGGVTNANGGLTLGGPVASAYTETLSGAR